MEHFLLHVKILLNLKSLGKAVCKCDLNERFFTLLKRSRVWIKRRSTRVILVGTPALPHTGDHKPLPLGTDEIDILIVTWCAFMLKHEDQNEVSFKMSIDEQEGRLLQYLIAILFPYRQIFCQADNHDAKYLVPTHRQNRTLVTVGCPALSLTSR